MNDNLEEEFRRACETSGAPSEKIDSAITRGPCPDMVVGPVTGLSALKQFPYELLDSRNDSPPRLILVLESPHRMEFSKPKNDAVVPAPARGATGSCIRRHMLNIKGLTVNSRCQLVLMNAVQWQCSLGTKPLAKNCRDKVFDGFWNNGGADDFRKRLENYLQPGDVVFNCCTKGNTAGKPLQDLVQQTIQACLNDKGGVTTLTGNHPFSWRSEKNRTAALAR